MDLSVSVMQSSSVLKHGSKNPHLYMVFRHFSLLIETAIANPFSIFASPKIVLHLTAYVRLTPPYKQGNPSGAGARIGNLIIHVQIAITCEAQLY